MTSLIGRRGNNMDSLLGLRSSLSPAVSPGGLNQKPVTIRGLSITCFLPRRPIKPVSNRQSIYSHSRHRLRGPILPVAQKKIGLLHQELITGGDVAAAAVAGGFLLILNLLLQVLPPLT